MPALHRRSRPAAALLGVVVIEMVLGCGTPPPAGPLRPILRLADARHGRPGDPSTAAVPVATVGGERRPVLANVAPVTLKIEALVAPVPAAVRVTFPIPLPLRGGTLRLSVLPFGVEVVHQEPRTVPGAGAEQTIDIGLRDKDPNAAGKWLLVSARRGASERSYLSDPFPVRAGARLRFGIGVEDLDWPTDLPPVTFTLGAVDPGRTRPPEVLFRMRLDPASDRTHRQWIDHEVDLGSLAGRSVRLEFTATPETADAAAPVVFPVWSDPTIVAPAGPAARPNRNVVMISLDTLRADHLGCYGYPRPTSPAIDRLAADGTLFERAYSSFPSTTGSHMTLFTSLYPCAHGLGMVAGTNELAPDVHTLAELMRAGGYGTAAFTEAGGLSLGNGFGRGFATYVENLSNKGDPTKPPGERTFGDARAWIERHADEGPWFVFIHTYQVHTPLAPPPGYRERVTPDSGPADTVALYDGELRYLDDLVARLVGGLGTAGVADDTVLLLFSDHGEQFGEHGIHGHQNSLYDVLLHVPLVFHAPGLVSPGTRVPANVGLVDVTPTILDLVGLPPLAAAQGRSLVPMLRGEHLPEAPLFAELPGPHAQIAVRSGGFKWIVHEKTGVVQAYRDDDPGEQKDVASVAPSSASLVATYRRFCRTPSAPTGAGPIESFDPVGVREKLRALGYVE